MGRFAGNDSDGRHELIATRVGRLMGGMIPVGLQRIGGRNDSP